MSEEAKKTELEAEEIKTNTKFEKIKKIVGYIITALVGAAVAFGILKSDDIKEAVTKGEEKQVVIQQAMYTVDNVVNKLQKTDEKVVEEIVVEVK